MVPICIKSSRHDLISGELIERRILRTITSTGIGNANGKMYFVGRALWIIAKVEFAIRAIPLCTYHILIIIALSIRTHPPRDSHRFFGVEFGACGYFNVALVGGGKDARTVDFSFGDKRHGARYAVIAVPACVLGVAVQLPVTHQSVGEIGGERWIAGETGSLLFNIGRKGKVVQELVVDGNHFGRGILVVGNDVDVGVGGIVRDIHIGRVHVDGSAVTHGFKAVKHHGLRMTFGIGSKGIIPVGGSEVVGIRHDANTDGGGGKGDKRYNYEKQKRAQRKCGKKYFSV